MKKPHPLVIAAILTACGSGSTNFDEMAKSRWASNSQVCDSTFTTFSHRAIRMHSPEGTVDFGKITRVSDAAPSLAILTVEPSKTATQSPPSKYIHLPEKVVMAFDEQNGRLRLVAMSGVGDNGEANVIDPSAIQSGFFDLVKCAK